MSCKKCDEDTSIEGIPTVESTDPNLNLTYSGQCITPSPCSAGYVPNYSQCGCGYNPCQCTVPYYRKVSMCPEDNTEKVVIHYRAATFKTVTGFCMPTCGGSVRVVFENAADVPIGAWLWAQGYGYLTIKAFNPLNHEIELQNDCPDLSCNSEVNAAPGTTIPACTIFTIGFPICGGSGTGVLNGIYLASGFVAPANGSCIEVAVTGVQGVSINKNIGILTGIYRVDAILSNTRLRICNNGSGLTQGTVVDYLDSNGNYIVPIALIDSNPCAANAVLSGVPLVCDGGDVSVPLTGVQTGQVLVWDEGTDTAAFRTLGLPVLDCVALLSAFTLDPNNPNGFSYLILVPTADFTVGQIITVAGTPFTVDSIDTATQLHATPVTDPALVYTFPAGATVCSSGCCEENTARIEILEDLVINNAGANGGVRNWADQNINESTSITPTTITTGQFLTGNNAVLTFYNDSGDYNMGTLFILEYDIVFDLLSGTNGDTCDILCSNEYFAGAGIVIGAFSASKSFPNTYRYDAVSGSGGVNRKSFHFSETISRVVIPGAHSPYTVATRCRLQLNGNDLDTGVRVNVLNARITALGVAVR